MQRFRRDISKGIILVMCAPPSGMENNRFGNSSRGGCVRPDIYAKKQLVIILIFTEASGYLVPNLFRFDQNRILWGLFGGGNVPP